MCVATILRVTQYVDLAARTQLVCQGLIFGNGPRPQIASEEKSRCTRSNSALRLKDQKSVKLDQCTVNCNDVREY